MRVQPHGDAEIPFAVGREAVEPEAVVGVAVAGRRVGDRLDRLVDREIVEPVEHVRPSSNRSGSRLGPLTKVAWLIAGSPSSSTLFSRGSSSSNRMRISIRASHWPEAQMRAIAEADVAVGLAVDAEARRDRRTPLRRDWPRRSTASATRPSRTPARPPRKAPTARRMKCLTGVVQRIASSMNPGISAGSALSLANSPGFCRQRPHAARGRGRGRVVPGGGDDDVIAHRGQRIERLRRRSAHWR